MTETIGRTAFEETLRGLAPKVAGARKLRRGDIAFRLTGGTDVVLAAEKGKAEVVPAAGRTGKPLVEVIGDADAVHKVLSGAVEGRKQFLAGGIRVRGDLRYLSDLATELGLLAKPL
jgi:SCP-2 sterol transfer family